MIVSKFGGTSLADAQRYRHAAALIRADSRRRYVVVSAPGRRNPEDIKITDQLLQFHRTGREEDFLPVALRFRQIVAELGLELDLEPDFEEILRHHGSADFVASRGEYLSARILAAFLGWPFLDARTCIFFDEEGGLEEQKTQQALFEMLREQTCGVLPGFYGAMPDGEIRTFSRGGSDISGALVASAMDAEVYENWTDVDGILVTDPRIVPQADPIPAITYSELRELAYRGASVLHEAAVVPVRRKGLPIHICNTFCPEAPGSWIVAGTPEITGPITGIAGRMGYSSIQIERENTNSSVGYVRRILSCLEELQIPFEHLATGIGSVCLVVPTAALTDHREQLVRGITRAVHPDTLRIQDALAMIAVVGRGMVNKFGICARLFDALAAVGIPVRVIDQGATEMNIVVGVDEKDYASGVRAIYQAFFE